MRALRLQGEGLQHGDLDANRLRPSASAGAVEAAEVQLVDDRQHEDLEAHHVHLRAARLDAQRSPSRRAR
jgi:hypothetical protein